MNAPATIKPPANNAAVSTLPFNLQPYSDGAFEEMHAAGSMTVSASSVGAIFNKIPQRYGKLAYALHISGEQPLPDISGEPLIKAGHLLEPLIREMLAEELGVEVFKCDAFSKHEWLPLFATPDAWCWIDGVPHIVELKMVTPKVFWTQWQDGPPIHVGLQHQTQFACTGAEAGIIGVLSTGHFQLEFFETKPHQPTIERIELGVDNLMATLERGDLPKPDDTEPDFEAFRRLMWKSEPGSSMAIETDEARLRALQFLQAKRDEKAATATIEANKRWFQGRMEATELATLGDGTTVTWKTNKTKPKGGDRPIRRFDIKQSKGQENGHAAD